MRRLMVCGFLAAVLSGCASSDKSGKWTAESPSPGIVGKWSAESPPPGTRSMTLELNADGTWVCVQESDRPYRFGGTWKKDDSGNVILKGEEGQEYTAKLQSKEELIAELDPVEPPFEFKRLR